VRILVTGGAGAIGSHLVTELLADGHAVTVLDDLSSGRSELVPSGARLVVGSVVDDAALDDALLDSPDLVAHLAARFANQNSVDSPRDDLMVNGLGSLMVLERSLAAGVAKVLVVSSSCVYPIGELLAEPMLGRSHDTPYAITKSLTEEYARFFADHHGLDTVIIRPFNAYGPHELPGPYRNVIPNFFRTAMSGAPLRITGSEETRDFTFVTDIAHGMALALVRPTTPGDAFNLASGRRVRIVDLANAINELTGNAAGIEYAPRRSWDSTIDRRAAIDHARDVLGYSPTVGLEDGLARTHEWLRSVDA
jgi:UDP-glucose 4-epimerase